VPVATAENEVTAEEAASVRAPLGAPALAGI
jgi:hypothetical protein